MNETGSIHDLLDSQNWNEIILKLAAFAVSICRYKRISLPKGQEPEDIVMEAIDRVYRLERKWDPENDPDLFEYLKSVVVSLISNEVKSMDASKHDRTVEIETLSVSIDDRLDDRLYYEQLDLKILDVLGGDLGLCLVYKALKDGYKQLEIAQVYGINIKDVRNACKRLARVAIRARKLLQIQKQIHE